MNKNEDLEWIRRIDPDITRVVIHGDLIDSYNHDTDWGAIGHCIGQNPSIKEISLSLYNELYRHIEVDRDRPISGRLAKKWEALFNGVSLSRSIESIELYDYFLGGRVLKLLEIPNLERVHFRSCIITNQTASAIRRVLSLQDVGFTGDVQYFDGTDAADFVASLNHNHKIERLWLYGLPTEEGGIRALVDILSNPQSNIKSLCFPCRLGREHADAVAIGLKHNTTLKEVDMSNLERITSAGWRALLSSLKNPNLKLTTINISGTRGITDKVVPLLSEFLSSQSDTIQEISLTYLWRVSSAGWAALSAAFLHPMPKLKELRIRDNKFDDDACAVLATGMNNKPLLENLSLSTGKISAKGWNAFATVMCNTSSLDALQKSNHTLREILQYDSNSLPPHIKKLLQMNRSRTAPSEVLKIVEYCDKINIESLIKDQPEMQMKLDPSVISWIGKEQSNHNALYNFIRNQSYLLERAGTHANAD